MSALCCGFNRSRQHLLILLDWEVSDGGECTDVVHAETAVLCRENHWDRICDNNIDLESDELGREHGGAIAASLRPAILDDEVATFDPAEDVQPLPKGGDPIAMGRKRSRAQEPDGRWLRRLLRARREWPRNSRAAEQRDELAASHSITSSASNCSELGTSMPSALAVCRLMTNSNLVDCTTGRSAGF